jgi:hypothetical protein
VRNLVGQKFYLLTVKEYVGLTGGGQKKKYGIHKGFHTWKCQCECGKETLVRELKLLAGTTKSCGCYKKTVKPKWTLSEGEAAKNLLFNSYIKSAVVRKLSFSLSKETFINLTSKTCHYCNSAPSKSVKRLHSGRNDKNNRSMNGDYIYNGLDRIDNDKGYTDQNVVTCCWKCNELKKNSSYEDFLAHVFKIADNLRNKK